MINILYIHGFNSSPISLKARQTKQFTDESGMNIHYLCPALDISPAVAMQQLIECIETRPNAKWHLIGSSLGGYYATYLSEKYGFKAAIVNPAVKPYELLRDYINEVEILPDNIDGQQNINVVEYKNYHTGEPVIVKACFMDELKQLEETKIMKENYYVMLQTGDEVLDYQQAEKKYQGCRVITEQGGDHSFVNFQKHLPDIITFFMQN